MISVNKIVILSALCAVIFISGCSEPKGQEKDKVEDAFAVPVKVVSLQRGDISAKFHTTATLEARNEADIISRVTGIIEHLNVEEGDYVEKGQLLAKIDPRRYQLALDKSSAELAGINQELQRLSLMAEKKLVSQQASDKLKYQYQSAIAARELAALDLKDSKIVAPISGYISQRFVKKGHFTQGYQKLFHIVDQANLQAVVHLPEHQLENVKIDQQAVLRFSARPGKTYQGSVRSISPVVDSRSGTFKVILSLNNSKQQLKPGMFAEIALTFATRKNAFIIPNDAIITLDNQSKIFVVKDNKAVEVLINIGFVQEQLTEVIGDFTEGEQVVINGQHNLKTDASVEVLDVEKTISAINTADEVANSEKISIAKNH